MARAGTTLLTSEAIGSAVHARMDSARASPTIGTWDSASDSATGSGLEPGHGHGGARTVGDGGTITTTIISASITSTSTTIGIMELPRTAMIMVLIPGTAESGRHTGAPISIRIPVAAFSAVNR